MESYCHLWWPGDCDAGDPASQTNVSKTFQIVDECTGRANPSETLCVGNMPTALKVRDGDKVYSLDTGSSMAVLLNCKNGPLSNTTIPIHYGSETGVNKVLLENDELLGESFQPLCNISGLSKNHQDGLIGLSPHMTGQPGSGQWRVDDNLHSYMNQVSMGNRRVVVDKTKNTVCIGSECVRPEGLTESVITPLNATVMLPSFSKDGKKYVLDTGSTNSIGYPLGNGERFCIIGNHEITALDVDYDSSRIAYTVDMQNVDRLCKHDIP